MEKVLCNEGGEKILEEVSQRSGTQLIPGTIQGQV